MKKALFLVVLLGSIFLVYSNGAQAISFPYSTKSIFEGTKFKPKPAVVKPKPTVIKPVGSAKQILKPQITNTSCPSGSDCDNDGDGHTLVNGQDCNDSDSSVYPGAPEVCDARGKDEDCNPATVGYRDDDRDGYTSMNCTNTDALGTPVTGEDCDDQKEGIFPGIQVCDPSGLSARKVLICRRGGYSNDYSCLGSGEKCVVQPNASGVCVPE